MSEDWRAGLVDSTQRNTGEDRGARSQLRGVDSDYRWRSWPRLRLRCTRRYPQRRCNTCPAIGFGKERDRQRSDRCRENAFCVCGTRGAELLVQCRVPVLIVVMRVQMRCRWIVVSVDSRRFRKAHNTRLANCRTHNRVPAV